MIAMSENIAKKPTTSGLRGLGCGGDGSKPIGKITKVCMDCGEKSQVYAEEMFCPKCKGPLA
jgi:hypothetical protein